VTGFLGSGKTTLINAVLREPDFAGTLVIVNEFGEVGLDHALIANADDGVVLLDSGCLCCAASGTLRDTLIDIFTRRNSRSFPDIHHIIVETSGLANPGPLVATLIGDSALRQRCTLTQVITLVDPLNAMANLDTYAEARQQIAFADTLVITKVNQAPRETVEHVNQALAPLNKQAFRSYWETGQPAAPIFGSATINASAAARNPDVWIERLMKSGNGLPSLFMPTGENAPTSARPRVHGSAFAGIGSCILEFETCGMSWQAYASLTGALTRRYGRKLLRCKGLLHLGPHNEPWVIQGVQGYFAPPERPTSSAAFPADSFLVCILDGVDADDLLDFVHSLPDMPDIGLSRPSKDTY
jgi:G3E family GTPase